ncbi:MAG TPA: VWA domain-containing protein [Polyangiaceae bacterium]|nr:VWA domain-containing protein [Polyangiaceae bacterium]
MVLARTPRSRFALLLVTGLALPAFLLSAEKSKAQTVPAPYDCRSSDPQKWPPSSKPYFMLAVDTSGSMTNCTDLAAGHAGNDSCRTAAVNNSCGMEPTRLNDAKCAVRKTVEAFAGQVNFGLMTYAHNLTGCNAGDVPDSCSGSNTNGCNDCARNCGGEHYAANGCTITEFPGGDNGCGNGPSCAGASSNNANIYKGTTIGTGSTPPVLGGTAVTLPADGWRNGGKVVVDMLLDPTWNQAATPATNVPQLLEWVDGKTDNSREIFADGSTPLEGILRTAHQYYAGGWASGWTGGTYCASGGSTIDHAIPVDVVNDRTCRSLNVILVTDGDETCGGNAPNAATAMNAVGVVIQGVRVPIKTYVIGFAGATVSSLDAIAAAGGTTASYSANNEVELAQALSGIVSGAAAPEVCDNADNNCNGCIDEGSKLWCSRNKTARSLAYLQNAGNPKTIANCCTWTTTAERNACLSAYSASISAGTPQGSQWFLPCWDPTAAGGMTNPEQKWLCADPGETCDNLDNDCDQQVLTTATAPAALFSSNVADEQQLKCGSPAHCPQAEVCPPVGAPNGLDDDCDGVVDNASGSGVPGSICPGGCIPSPEICNGCDDDCDGVADNGITPLACGFSPPANCAGTRSCPAVAVASRGACIAGVTKPGVSQFGACSSTPGTTDVTCDNLDDNCNGVVDEGAPSTACTNGQPALVYKDVNPASVCVKGQQACHSTSCVGWVGPSTEICDGLDNDCNGIVDDGTLPGVNVDCGSVQGICTKGKTACVGGTLVCQGGTQPQPEICDGIDNNCNGQTDELPLTDGPAPGANGCWQNPGAGCTFANLTWKAPTNGTCTGVGTLTTPCLAGSLVCQGASKWACVGGVLPQPEVCDGVDNDCDGQLDAADSSITGTGAACAPPGTVLGSACQGTRQCVSAVLTCTGGATPSTEICDGIDNDCDGLVDGADPDLQGVGTTCGSSLGTCKTGTLACVSGKPVCQGEVKPGAEVCDGLDNDCNGAIDDNPTDAPAALGCWNLPGATCTGGGKTWSAPPGATCTGLGSLTTPCSAGSLVCAGVNKWVCQGGVLPTTEACDGKDNDCNGTADDGNPGGGTSCGTAPNVLPCKKGTFQCVSGQLLCQGEVKPSQELCDNVDNDCDGTVDNNLTSGVGAPCGSNLGICKKGVTACVAGTIQCSGETKPGTETCNGLDDDCDGTADDNLSDAPANPGCWTTPGSACTFKNVQWSPPNGATCNGTGSLTTPCKTGSLVCVGATGWVCRNDVPPIPEVCDNVDNNCNGQVDDGNPGGGVACGSKTGVCTQGVLSCTNGNLTCSGGTQPSPEICDGLDNNCDGQIDEPANLVGLGQICGSNVGTCKAGVTVCDAVTHKPVCQGEVKATAEICDGKDNDCNGAIDDNPTETPQDPGCWQNPGTTCNFATVHWDPPTGGTCTTAGTLSTPCKPGALICRNGGWECAGGRLPQASEVCDNVDNDCNNAVDDGDPGGGATCGQTDTGECQKGVLHCKGGQITCVGEIPPSPELCDGKDNDCNGTADDNAPGAGVPCTGQCATGTTACIGGTLICQSTVQAQPETCNGLDDDCNGLVDDGTLDDTPPDPDCWNNPGTTCSYKNAKWDPPAGGQCQDPGTLTAPCQMGRLRCDGSKGWSCVGGKLPTAEICDGQDQDCDGNADNGDPGGGAQCGINVGTCTFGTQHCVNGQLACDGQGKTAEVCNGKDDDCDGVVDNGLPLGNPCTPAYDTTKYPGDRTQGVCKKGKLRCDTTGTGTLLCEGGQGPQPEVCNGFDDDCDGQIDEAGDAPDGVNGSKDPNDPTRVVGGDCGSNVGACHFGKYVCKGGQLLCDGDVRPSPEICDCKDNDCDGQVDEDPAAPATLCGSNSACVNNGGSCSCAPKCKSGEFKCGSGQNCETLPLSSSSSSTVAVCISSNDPCAKCGDKTVADECGPAGTLDSSGRALPVCTCAAGDCHGPCFGVVCGTGSACVKSGPAVGECHSNTDCRFFDVCGDGKACNGGVCVDDPCTPNPCKATEVCKPSTGFDRARCEPSCANVSCKATERCQDGVCAPTGCAAPCANGDLCLPAGGDGGGACGPSKCASPTCADGSYCDPYTGSCGNDPCEAIRCPANQVCVAGECQTASSNGAGGSGNAGSTGAGGTSGTDGGGTGATPGTGGTGAGTGGTGQANGGQGGATSNEPPSKEVIGLATGGGGCRCELGTQGAPSRGALAMAALLLGALVTRRRARAEGGAR